MRTLGCKCAQEALFRSDHLSISILFGCLLLLALSMQPVLLRAQTYTDLHDFDYSNDGGYPYYPGIVAQGRDGSLYGTTYEGGLNGYGTVYKITPSGALTVLYSFAYTDGAYPSAGVTLATDGNLYGAASEGGTNGYGTIFKITPTGTLTTLHTFTYSDGCYPYAPPVQGKKGLVLYGTTTCGTAYSITPSGNFKEISSSVPLSYAPLLLASDGNFYEAAYSGGDYGYGAVYKFSTTGAVKAIHSFASTDGAYLIGPVVQGIDGNLYGTAYEGGSSGYGTAFKLSLKGNFTLLYNFTCGADGGYPYAGPVAATDGNVYGAAYACGNLSYGTLFEITKGGSFSVVNSFDYTHGGYELATPMQDTNGILYGQTYEGGANSYGAFWSLANGISPFASIVGFPAASSGTTVEILGQGFSGGVKSVMFGSGSANFTVVNDTYLTATVPDDGTTGAVTVTTNSTTLTTRQKFSVLPLLKSFTPTSGPVGTQVTINGSGFVGATSVTFGKVKATFTVNSGTQITATVPTGASTSKITVTTPGGKATSKATFTVT